MGIDQLYLSERRVHMRIVRSGLNKVKGRRMEFTCPHCDSVLRAFENEFTPFGIMDKKGDSRKLLFYCPVCKTRRVINRYKLIPVLRVKDYIRKALFEIADNELVYDDPDMREITYEY